MTRHAELEADPRPLIIIAQEQARTDARTRLLTEEELNDCLRDMPPRPTAKRRWDVAVIAVGILAGGPVWAALIYVAGRAWGVW